jgi:ectoine hydroxylase-related dioxygenase (phytanoyl-CoA dioxygenase family)
MAIRTATLQVLKATDPIGDVCAALRSDGVVIVTGMLDPAALQALRDEVTPYVEAADPAMRHLNAALQGFFGAKTRHVSGLAAKSPTFAAELMIHPVLLGVCDEVLLPSCARYQLNLGHLIVRQPGAEAQILHRDEDVWVHMPRPHPELQVATMTALVDFTPANGATRVVPGSNRWERGRQPSPSEIVDARMPAGSTAIYLGSTMHGAGTNTTADTWRYGAHLSYTLGWLRTEENNYLAVPPAVARTLPVLAQQVLGYAVHDAIANAGGYVGMVGLRDPIEMLASGELA